MGLTPHFGSREWLTMASEQKDDASDTNSAVEKDGMFEETIAAE